MEKQKIPDKIMKNWPVSIKFTGFWLYYWNKYGYSATLWKRTNDAYVAYINRCGEQFIQ